MRGEANVRLNCVTRQQKYRHNLERNKSLSVTSQSTLCALLTIRQYIF
jgi:hypothetical protein